MAFNTSYWNEAWPVENQQQPHPNQHLDDFIRPLEPWASSSSANTADNMRPPVMPQNDNFNTSTQLTDERRTKSSAALGQPRVQVPQPPRYRTVNALSPAEQHIFENGDPQSRIYDPHHGSSVARWNGLEGGQTGDEWFQSANDQDAGQGGGRDANDRDGVEHQQGEEAVSKAAQGDKNEDEEVQKPVWEESIGDPDQARAWLSSHPMGLVRVEQPGDNVDEHRANVAIHAKKLFDALHEAPPDARSDWTTEDAQYYNKYQTNGMTELDRLLSTKAGCRRAQSLCFLTIEEAFALHDLGTPPSRNKMKLDDDLGLSKRIFHMVSCMQIKYVGVKLLLDRDETRSNLVKNPKQVLKDRVHCAMNNSGKKVKTDIATKALGPEAKLPKRAVRSAALPRQSNDPGLGTPPRFQSQSSRPSASTSQASSALPTPERLGSKRLHEESYGLFDADIDNRPSKRATGQSYPYAMLASATSSAGLEHHADSHPNTGLNHHQQPLQSAMPSYFDPCYSQPPQQRFALDSYDTPSSAQHGAKHREQHEATALNFQPIQSTRHYQQYQTAASSPQLVQTPQDLSWDDMVPPLQPGQIFPVQSPLKPGWDAMLPDFPQISGGDFEENV